jgi:hypothetical protein
LAAFVAVALVALGGYGGSLLFAPREVEGHRNGQQPVVVQNCRVHRTKIALGVLGVGGDYRTAAPCRSVALRNNDIHDCTQGIVVVGAARRLQIVGNRIQSTSLCAMQLENLLPGAGKILIANNTAVDANPAFRLWDDSVKGEEIELVNNLILGTTDKPDVVFLDSGGDQFNVRGPGNGRALLEHWRFRNNWRELRQPMGDDLMSKSWTSPGPDDRREDQLEVISRDPSSPDFLRPPKNSPLATQGAGTDDTTMPVYIGAVPPADVEAWDWDQTWKDGSQHE